MKLNLKTVYERLKSNPKIIVIIGICGILLIFLSSQFGSRPKDTKSDSDVKITAEEYARSLEQKLEKSVEHITGGRASVMVTLQSDIEYIYANEIKSDSSELTDSGENNKQKLKKDGSKSSSCIIVKDSGGNEIPLVVTSIMPQIKGVVVNCTGGSNEAVSSAVTEMVTTALSIGKDKVCVLGYVK